MSKRMAKRAGLILACLVILTTGAVAAAAGAGQPPVSPGVQISNVLQADIRATAPPSTGGGGGAPPPAGKVEKPVRPGTATAAEIPGKVKVEVPPGAVTGANAAIKAEAIGDEKASGAGMPLIGRVVDVTLKNGTLTGRIAITLYFDKTKLNKDQEPAAFYFDEKTGKWVRLPGVADADKGTITFTVDHLTTFAIFAVAIPKPPEAAFKDIAGHWAEKAILDLAQRDLLVGYPDGTFRPDNKITRAEFVAVLVKALELSPQGGKVFNDTAGHWAGAFIATAAANGIVTGYNETQFGPDDNITREQMVVMVVRATRLNAMSGERSFADGDWISAWAKDAIVTASENNIITGYPDGTFRPGDNATRAEAVTVVVRVLK